jgi:hypothetical protein
MEDGLKLLGHQIKCLMEVKYTIAWARVRGSARAIARWVLFLLVAAYGLYASTVTGAAFGMLVSKQAHGELFLTRLLGALALLVTVLSLVWGPSEHGPFSRRALRRFPIAQLARWGLYHANRVLTPFWGAVSLLVLALCGATAVLQGQGLALACCFALVLIVWFYQLCLFAQYLLKLLLQHMVVSATSVALLLVGAGLLGRFFHLVRPDSASSLLRSLPFAEAAHGFWIGSYQGLYKSLAWLAVGFAALFLLPDVEEGASATSKTMRELSIRALLNAQSTWFVLAGKSLRYHLACNRVRLGMVVSPPMLLAYVKFMGPRMGVEGASFGGLAACFVLPFFATRPMTLNHFGYDGAGLKRYLILPIGFADFLLADAVTSGVIGVAVGLIGIVIFLLTGVVHLHIPDLVLSLSALVCGAVMFNAAGMIVSVLNPRRIAISKIIGNDMSFMGNVVLYAGFIAPFALAFFLSDKIPFQTLLSHWIVATCVLALLTAASAVTWRWTRGSVELHKIELVNELR